MLEYSCSSLFLGHLLYLIEPWEWVYLQLNTDLSNCSSQNSRDGYNKLYLVRIVEEYEKSQFMIYFLYYYINSTISLITLQEIREELLI